LDLNDLNMIIGGVQKNSFIDYPGKISCVLFLSGCNFICPYCHNPELARGRPTGAFCPSLEEFHDFLDSRRSFLEGVVISGGEPTLQADLPEICTSIKKRGYRVKLDTNGSRPQMVRRLIDERLVDFVAMDIKTDPSHYPPLIHVRDQERRIRESIGIVMRSAVAYEFRTTCVKPIINTAIIDTISRRIEGAMRYVLQSFQDQRLLNPAFFQDIDPAFTPEQMVQLKEVAQPWVGECVIR
jgi:pyruvate formate lyase activating enzyme